MADPNTQIDWWIAQTWQEAQGGADSDALVAWLHENGLTAISSYTILQAALNCPAEEARQMVFSHPAWASEDASQDLTDIGYTSETLEPEPEPDPTFELDEWAEETEEQGPVYGEEGYSLEPGAGALPPERPDAAEEGSEAGYGDSYSDGLAHEEAASSETAADRLEYPEPWEGVTDQAASLTGADPDMEEAADIGTGSGLDLADETEQDALSADPGMSGRYGDDVSLPEDESPEWSQANSESSDIGHSRGYDRTDIDLAGMAVESANTEAVTAAQYDSAGAGGDANPAFQTEPEPERPSEVQSPTHSVTTTMDAQSAPAPAPRPPSTPGERAAVFAAAFGKKPGAAPANASPGFSASLSQNKAPPSTDSGPATYAEVAPAQTSREYPQPTSAAAVAPMPPPAVFDPLPPTVTNDTAAAQEPLFGSMHRQQEAPQPLFAEDEPAKEEGTGDGTASPAYEPEPDAPVGPAVEDSNVGGADVGWSDLPDGDETDLHCLEPEPAQELQDEPVLHDAEANASENEEEIAEPDAAPFEVGEDQPDSPPPEMWVEPGPAEMPYADAPGEPAESPLDANDDISADDEVADDGAGSDAFGEPDDEIAADDTGSDAPEEPDDQFAADDAGSDASDGSEKTDPAVPPAEEGDLGGHADIPEEAVLHADVGGDAAAEPAEARTDPRTEGDGKPDVTGEAAERTAPPRKRILLDPEEDRRQAMMRQAEARPDASDTESEDMADAARRLGIDFRMGDPRDAGIDPKLTQAARELGVSFREEPTLSMEETDEMALAAQKLGISFRDPVLESGKPQKSLLVRYLPLLIVVIVIFFLLLAAAPFAPRIVSWF